MKNKNILNLQKSLIKNCQKFLSHLKFNKKMVQLMMIKIDLIYQKIL